MVMRSQGRKKSEFPANTAFPADTQVDFFAGGVNYRMALIDFLAALNVTGSIEQDGAITGTPLLDIQGPVNIIRSLENGPGIFTEVSPENGALIRHNFTFNDEGARLMVDPDIESPVFRSLAAGAGVGVTEVGNRIVITAVGETAGSNTVIVNSIEDFPAAIAGVITLESGKDYFLTNNITTNNRFVLSDSNSIRGAGTQVINLTYLGADNMFTGSDTRFKLQDLTLECPNGNLLNITGPLGITSVSLVECNVGEVETLGTVSGCFFFRIDSGAFIDIKTNGLIFAGTNTAVSINVGLAILNGGTLFDLGAATFETVSINGVLVTSSAAGTVFLSGASGSANIVSGGGGYVSNNIIFGDAAPLAGITPDDLRWTFQGNADILDTDERSMGSIVGSTTETIISAINTPVKAAGTWTSEQQSFFSFDTTGKSTYLGPRTFPSTITASCTLLMATGAVKRVKAYLAINGAVVPATVASASVNSSDPQALSLVWSHHFATNDFVEVFLENTEDTTNIILQSAVLRMS